MPKSANYSINWYYYSTNWTLIESVRIFLDVGRSSLSTRILSLEKRLEPYMTLVWFTSWRVAWVYSRILKEFLADKE